MNQIQIQEQSKGTLDRARLIATSKRVRWTSNRKIWCVQSENPKTPTKFYMVMWNKELDGFVCDCKAFEFSSDNKCKHIYACAIFEGCNV